MNLTTNGPVTLNRAIRRRMVYCRRQLMVRRNERARGLRKTIGGSILV